MNDPIYEEKRRHSSLYIPYTYYECVVPTYFPCVPLHWHDEFEINLILKGRGMFRCNDRSFEVSEGDIVIILPNKLHSISYIENEVMAYDTIVFNRSLLCGNSDDRCYTECLSDIFAEDASITLPISTQNKDYTLMKEAASTIMNCAKENSGMADLLLKSELTRLFWLIIKNCEMHSSRSPYISDKNIKAALEYINKNYSSDLTIKELAENVHLSESYFMGKFKEITGMSVMEYVSAARIRAACRLLINSGCTAAEAAFEVGFRNLSNFNRQFKKAAGCSPREYRRNFIGHNAPSI